MFNTDGSSLRNSRSLTSTTIANFVISADWLESSINFGNSTTGRLSTQKKFKSSKTFIAVLLPAPEGPLIMTRRTFFIGENRIHESEYRIQNKKVFASYSDF